MNNNKHNQQSIDKSSEYNKFGSKNLELCVFISYSRDYDRVVTGLFAQALSNQGFKTLFDRRLYPGANITDNICDQIADAHVVILILSEKSMNSPWVNQELGYARALNKPIIPIKIEKHIQNAGMFMGTNEFDFDTDWFNHESSIQKLTHDIYRAIEKKDTSATIIESKEERTRRITEAFYNVNALLQNEKNSNMKIKIFKRTRISIFSVGKSLDNLTNRYNPYYWGLLRDQRESIQNFINNKNVEVRLLLNYMDRNYLQDIDIERLKELVKYVEEVNDNNKYPHDLNSRFFFMNERHNQSNITALNNHFIFEGLKTRSSTEYLYTLHWKYPSNKFHQFFSSFDNMEYWKTAKEILPDLKKFLKQKEDEFSKNCNTIIRDDGVNYPKKKKNVTR